MAEFLSFLSILIFLHSEMFSKILVISLYILLYWDDVVLYCIMYFIKLYVLCYFVSCCSRNSCFHVILLHILLHWDYVYYYISILYTLSLYISCYFVLYYFRNFSQFCYFRHFTFYSIEITFYYVIHFITLKYKPIYRWWDNLRINEKDPRILGQHYFLISLQFYYTEIIFYNIISKTPQYLFLLLYLVVAKTNYKTLKMSVNTIN